MEGSSHSQRELDEQLDGISLGDWLFRQGLIDTTPTDVSVQDSSWERLGSETYTLPIFITADNDEIQLIAKACIKPGPAEAMLEWIERRKLVEASGISTPQLVVQDSASIIEEYIPYSLDEAYAQADEDGRTELRTQFADTYQKLRSAGFNPIGLHDVRSRGLDVVLIDFGEDLGAPLNTDKVHDPHALFEEGLERFDSAVARVAA